MGHMGMAQNRVEPSVDVGEQRMEEVTESAPMKGGISLAAHVPHSTTLIPQGLLNI